MSNRFYFDYNATSPFSNKVLDFVRSGEFLFGNPASQHLTGKRSRKYINDSTDYLFKTFNLNPNHFHLLYHSGATEGINTFFKGSAFHLFKEKKKASYFFSSVDHACVVELKEDLEVLGHDVFTFDVDQFGNFNLEELIKKINSEKNKGHEVFINFTYMNNETGIIWPLSLAQKIKKETSAFIHVDAVQIVGKMNHWEMLSSEIDCYTFSGHKFGAMKGVGFSFVNKVLSISPLLVGGTQQQGLRAGTENAIGIYSLKLALEDLKDQFSAEILSRGKNLIEKNLADFVGDRGVIVGSHSANRNLNTIFLVLHGLKAETLSAKFDLLGVDLSTGSACSSGIIKENRILMAMGFSSLDSRSSLRFSFSPLMSESDAQIYSEKKISVLKTILN